MILSVNIPHMYHPEPHYSYCSSTHISLFLFKTNNIFPFIILKSSSNCYVLFILVAVPDIQMWHSHVLVAELSF